MANVPLRSLTFPKLPNKYIVPQIDSTLSQAGEAADAKAVGDALNNLDVDDTLTQQGKPADAKAVGDEITDIKEDLSTKSDTAGAYDNMTVGTAKQLLSDTYTEDKVPYLLRPTGGSADVGTREFDSIVGGTVAWNQLIKYIPATVTREGVAFTNNGDGSITANGTSTGTAYCSATLGQTYVGHKLFIKGCPAGGSISTYGLYLNAGSGGGISPSNPDVGNGVIVNVVTASPSANYSFVVYAGTTMPNLKIYPQIFDLTQMFGTAIADRAYALEQASEGSGIAWLKSMGFFTEDYYPYDAGTLKSVEGLQSHTMRDADDNIIASYPLDSSLTLRGIPKLDANNQLYYDGDEYAADGAVTRKYGVVDLGIYNWSYNSTNGYFYTKNPTDAKAPETNNIAYKAVSSKYEALDVNGIINITTIDKKIGYTTDKYTIIKDSAYTDADAFKAAMSGVMLVYELATPTTETAEPFHNPQLCDPDGTEEYVTTGIVPVGHDTQYLEDLKAKIEGLPWDLSMIAPIENGTTASQAYSTGQYFMHGNQFCKALTSIASGATFTLNTNYTVTTVAAELYTALNS